MKRGVIFISSLFLIGCSSKSFIALSNNGLSHNKIIIKTDRGSITLSRTGSFIFLDSRDKLPDRIGYIEPSKLKQRYALLYKSIPRKPRSYIVYFKPNSLELTSESKRVFLKALKDIRDSSPCMVDIIGHTYTSSNNSIRLSLSRAEYIKSLINRDRELKILKITARGYGERKLFVKTTDNISEPRNRNVEIFIK